MKHYRSITSLFILTLLLAACASTEGVSEEQAIENARLTLEAGLTLNTAPEQAPAVEVPAEQAPAAEAAPATETPILGTPTIMVTSIAEAATVSVTVDTNCRTGPGAPYGIIGSLSASQSATVAAQASVNNYVLIHNPEAGGADCWLWLQYGTVSGDISGLPEVTPIAIIDWSGTWTQNTGGPNFTTVITQTGNLITAISTLGSDTATASGTLSADERTFTGTYTNTLGQSGTLIWQLVPGTIDQFTGKGQNLLPVKNNYPSCGWRNGAPMPKPCLGP